jgi:hypothetical protein
MKKILFGMSLLACAAAATADTTAAAHCVDFAAAGYCDAMQYDSGFKATWHNYDCGGSQGKQTKALYFKGTTVCDGTKGCNPAAAYGWDSLNWKFNKTASTGTLTGTSAGVEYILQQDMPVAISSGACAVSGIAGGKSVLSR